MARRGRPPKDPAAILRVAVAPPQLDATMLRLWHAEFDRFPPGYFTPSDVSGMVLYLETLHEYQQARWRAAKAKTAAARKDEREEVRAIRRQLIALQRALRMYPSTRTPAHSAARLASDPTAQAPKADDGRPRWEQMMDDAQGKPN